MRTIGNVCKKCTWLVFAVTKGIEMLGCVTRWSDTNVQCCVWTKINNQGLIVSKG